MARNLKKLKAECERNGLEVLQAGREAKGPYEKALRDFYWQREFGSKPMPPQLHPMLARNIKDVDEATAAMMWESPNWVAQEKIDGCRLLMFIGEDGSTFTSRRLSDKTYRYSENTDQLPHLKTISGRETGLTGTVLDGEGVCMRPDVNTGDTVTKHQLQATVALLAIDPKESERIQREQDAWLVYRVFDILMDRGRDVTKEAYSSRYLRMKEAVSHIDHEHIQGVPVVVEGKREYYENIVRNRGEGIMLKDANAPYEASSSRPKAMFKVKKFEEFDLFVTGFVPSAEDRGWEKLIGSLELSAYTETGQKHITACAGNMTMEDRISATACRHCGHKVTAVTDNVNGKRVVLSVGCSNKDCTQYMKEFGPSDVMLHESWLNKVFIVRGMEFTARVYRLFQARIMSERFDKAPEDCTIDLAAIKAKFESQAQEVGAV